jgi:putative restriction endonuclease
MTEKRRLWTEEELIVVFNLYLKMPFGQMSATNQRVKNMAQLIGRTPSSVAMRLVNYAAVDPFHINRGVSGLKGGAKQTQPIFDMYIANKEKFTFESELILAKMQGTTVKNKFKKEIEILDYVEGKTSERLVKIRVNQSVFRQIVLNNYEHKCAISQIDIPELLVASHIVPWSKDEKNRMNPSNGIALNNLYDQAFDRGLITFDNEMKIVLSQKLIDSSNQSVSKYFHKIDKKTITLPERFIPDSSFLEYHRKNIFR